VLFVLAAITLLLYGIIIGKLCHIRIYSCTYLFIYLFIDLFIYLCDLCSLLIYSFMKEFIYRVLFV
jgi:hypothetical protein